MYDYDRDNMPCIRCGNEFKEPDMKISKCGPEIRPCPPMPCPHIVYVPCVAYPCPPCPQPKPEPKPKPKCKCVCEFECDECECRKHCKEEKKACECKCECHEKKCGCHEFHDRDDRYED